ncbi:hydrogenase assembly protein HupF [Neosynechococcus sphagnicola sy1]|uniref:Hydrogenase assembly protein HupF n=1 Tax=Neosynechococcus sphagnicola sy1 TaxID=1497020 RepID=A0A098TIJ2_9CYAN|nr:HypC/HybG/HupF family hydrogenase formation chaperone [Neosynechococcus sphagnicola]KGF71846.1 hydrogenase assembly protein HupF [Neosynechococcus sphagnicola sy1]
MCLAIPGQLISIDQPLPGDGESPEDAFLRRTGKVSFSGILKRVSLAYVPDVTIGDYVIVHVGFALSILDQAEAQETLMYLEQLQPGVED